MSNPSHEVIDLTVSSDDEETALETQPPMKRKAVHLSSQPRTWPNKSKIVEPLGNDRAARSSSQAQRHKQQTNYSQYLHPYHHMGLTHNGGHGVHPNQPPSAFSHQAVQYHPSSSAFMALGPSHPHATYLPKGNEPQPKAESVRRQLHLAHDTRILSVSSDRTSGNVLPRPKKIPRKMMMNQMRKSPPLLAEAIQLPGADQLSHSSEVSSGNYGLSVAVDLYKLLTPPTKTAQNAVAEMQVATSDKPPSLLSRDTSSPDPSMNAVTPAPDESTKPAPPEESQPLDSSDNESESMEQEQSGPFQTEKNRQNADSISAVRPVSTSESSEVLCDDVPTHATNARFKALPRTADPNPQGTSPAACPTQGVTALEFPSREQSEVSVMESKETHGQDANNFSTIDDLGKLEVMLYGLCCQYEFLRTDSRIGTLPVSNIVSDYRPHMASFTETTREKHNSLESGLRDIEHRLIQGVLLFTFDREFGPHKEHRAKLLKQCARALALHITESLKIAKAGARSQDTVSTGVDSSVANFNLQAGCKRPAVPRNHKLVGENIYREWLDSDCVKQGLYGQIRGCCRIDSNKEFLMFDVEYFTRTRRIYWGDGQEPPSKDQITEEIARGAIATFNEKLAVLGTPQIDKPIGPGPSVRWLVPGTRAVTNEPGLEFPRIDIQHDGFVITFRAKRSSIPGAGLGLWRSCRSVFQQGPEFFELPAGTLLDLGIYAPLHSTEFKKWHVMWIKNLLHEWKPTGWSFDMKTDGVYDITGDADGELTALAKKNIMVYTNETDGRAIPDITVQYDPEQKVHYLLGHLEARHGPLRIAADGTEEECKVDYLEAYEKVRVRKGYSRLEEEKQQALRNEIKEEDNLVFRHISQWNGHQLVDVVEFLERVYNSEKITASAYIRGLLATLAVADRISTIEESFGDSKVDPVKDELFGYFKLAEFKLEERVETLVGKLRQHWSSPSHLKASIIALDLGHAFFCKRFNVSNLSKVEPQLLWQQIWGIE